MLVHGVLGFQKVCSTAKPIVSFAAPVFLKEVQATATSKLITLHKQYFNAARIDVTSGLLKSKVKLNTIMVTYMQQTAYITIPVAAISVVVVMYPCSFRPAPSQNGGNLEGQGIRTKMKLFQRCVHIWKEMTKSS